jgi:Immunity protein 50
VKALEIAYAGPKDGDPPRADIDSLIVGSEKLTKIFGYWPSFHDAEVLDFHFWRGEVNPDQGIYDFPVPDQKTVCWPTCSSNCRVPQVRAALWR